MYKEVGRYLLRFVRLHLSPFLNDISGLLSDTIHSRLQMARRYDRDNRRIHDRQMLRSIYHQFIVHTAAQLLLHHRARARRVRKRRRQRRLRQKRRVDVFVSDVLCAGNCFRNFVSSKLRTRPHAAEEAQADGHDVAVNGVDEGVEGHGRGSGGVAGVEIDGAAG